MAIIGFCGQNTSKFLKSLNVKKVYVVAVIDIKELENQGVPVEYKTILAEYESYYKEIRNKEFLTIVEEIKKLGKDDLVLFQCQYGQWRSYAAATLVARVLGQSTLTRVFIDNNGRIKMSDGCEHDDGILAESMYDSFQHFLQSTQAS